MATPELIELTTTGWAVGGEAVGRDPDGRAVFVEGALAQERVRVEITDARRRFARGHVVEVLDAAPGRVSPTCPEVAAGCGGCDLASVDLSTQREAKSTMIHDALTRLGGIDPAVVPAIGSGPMLSSRGFRTSVRASVRSGQAGLRRRRSHESVSVGSCEVSHPLVEELLVDGRYGDATEVLIRVGARTGDRMVMVTPTASGVEVPDGVLVVGADELTAGRRAWIFEEVHHRRFRVSAQSFFQSRPDGADALVEVVGATIRSGAPDAASGRLLDLCSGVGLFSGTLTEDQLCAHVVAVESNRSSVADARVNLAGLGDHARVVCSTFETWRPSTVDVVVADPARSGLGRAGVDVVAATGAGLVVLVSCDAGSLGRDAGLLCGAGFEIGTVTLVDLFPQTSHVEVVTTFARTGSEPS